MEPFATVADLEGRYRKLDDAEKARANVLLKDATEALVVELALVGKEVSKDDSVQMGLLEMVCCNMVKRVLANGTSADISQMSEARGPFSTSYTFSNPSADMYIREDERRWLGIPKRRSRIGFIGQSHMLDRKAPDEEAWS